MKFYTLVTINLKQERDDHMLSLIYQITFTCSIFMLLLLLKKKLLASKSNFTGSPISSSDQMPIIDYPQGNFDHKIIGFAFAMKCMNKCLI